MEKELRQAVKDAARRYYQSVHGTKKEFNYIPPSGKLLDEEDLLQLIDASLDMWLTAGRFNDQFEKEFAQFLGVPFALTTNSGSSANLLALTALSSHKLGDKRLQKGDEVITVAAGFPTTVNPIIQNGLVPVFIDCEIATYNIDATQIETAISPKTKAIFLAHTLGHLFDMERILALCQKYHLWLIEDSCDALGAEWNGKKAGTIGHIGTYSFYPAHHITMGEGGAVKVAKKKPTFALDDDDEANLTAAQRSLIEAIRAALDDNNRKEVLKLVQRLQKSPEWPDGIPKSIKLAAIEALGWFGSSCLPEYSS